MNSDGHRWVKGGGDDAGLKNSQKETKITKTRAKSFDHGLQDYADETLIFNHR
jgi:hypothetical protein